MSPFAILILLGIATAGFLQAVEPSPASGAQKATPICCMQPGRTSLMETKNSPTIVPAKKTGAKP